MRKILFLSGLFVITILTFAQTPNWYDSKQRASLYPSDKYFSGFVVNELEKGEDPNKALERVKIAARVEAVSTIRTHVQAVIENYKEETLSTDDIEFVDRFKSQTVISTDAEIPGLKIESYRDGKYIAAFAFVKRRDLQRQLERQITMKLTRLGTQLDNAQELINKGEKAQAHSLIKGLENDFESIEHDQDFLLAVDPESDAEVLQLNETKLLKQRLLQMNADLKHGIYIVLKVDAQSFDGPYPSLENAIKGDLSQTGCSFTENQDEADWVVVVHSSAREHNTETYGTYTSYFVYVDAQLKISKMATKQTIYEDELSVKGADTRSNQNAARDAYRTIAPKISTIIKQQITQ